MTAKEYCCTHAPIATHDYWNSYIHGVEYGINDYVYISEMVQEQYCGPLLLRCHKLKIYDGDDGMYVQMPYRTFGGKIGKHRRYLDTYIRHGVWLNEISLEEWQKMLNERKLI